MDRNEQPESTASSRLSAWGTTALRVTLGATSLAHGIQKAVTWGWSGGVPLFEQARIPLAWLAAPLVTGVETAGGAGRSGLPRVLETPSTRSLLPA